MNTENNNDNIAIEFDGQLIANAVTAYLQMDKQLLQNEFLIFEGLELIEQGTFLLLASKEKMKVN